MAQNELSRENETNGAQVCGADSEAATKDIFVIYAVLKLNVKPDSKLAELGFKEEIGRFSKKSWTRRRDFSGITIEDRLIDTISGGFAASHIKRECAKNQTNTLIRYMVESRIVGCNGIHPNTTAINREIMRKGAKTTIRYGVVKNAGESVDAPPIDVGNNRPSEDDLKRYNIDWEKSQTSLVEELSFFNLYDQSQVEKPRTKEEEDEFTLKVNEVNQRSLRAEYPTLRIGTSVLKSQYGLLGESVDTEKDAARRRSPLWSRVGAVAAGTSIAVGAWLYFHPKPAQDLRKREETKIEASEDRQSDAYNELNLNLNPQQRYGDKSRFKSELTLRE